mmetsp:Transcript_2949/g.9692  ORF Transcript_2949/g.9692 Transcript_2949/m.9692 type:complete len:215 (-) Transcript_2949:178-822(-)
MGLHQPRRVPVPAVRGRAPGHGHGQEPDQVRGGRRVDQGDDRAHGDPGQCARRGALRPRGGRAGEQEGHRRGARGAHPGQVRKGEARPGAPASALGQAVPVRERRGGEGGRRGRRARPCPAAECAGDADGRFRFCREKARGAARGRAQPVGEKPDLGPGQGSKDGRLAQAQIVRGLGQETIQVCGGWQWHWQAENEARGMMAAAADRRMCACVW